MIARTLAVVVTLASWDVGRGRHPDCYARVTVTR